MKQYRTLRPGSEVTADSDVKRSRFHCVLAPAADEPQARATIDRVRRSHHDAGHHCSAFVLGPGREVTRTNDDGEPAGSAGQPMLAALLQDGVAESRPPVTDVVAVVARWFGGTKLGTGGLARAYHEVVVTALQRAPFLTLRALSVMSCEVDLRHLGVVQDLLWTQGCPVEVVRCTAHTAVLRLHVDPDQVRATAERLSSLTHGDVALVDEGTAWG